MFERFLKRWELKKINRSYRIIRGKLANLKDILDNCYVQVADHAIKQDREFINSIIRLGDEARYIVDTLAKKKEALIEYKKKRIEERAKTSKVIKLLKVKGE